jgi:hypothetical protein
MPNSVGGRRSDRERREQFGQEGSHFENEYFLALTYMPPLAATERLRGFMMSGGDSHNGHAEDLGTEALHYFKSRIRQFEEVFAAQFPVSRLKMLAIFRKRCFLNIRRGWVGVVFFAV